MSSGVVALIGSGVVALIDRRCYARPSFPKRAVSTRSGEALTAPIRHIYEARGEAALAILLPFTQICGGRRQGL